MFGATPTLGDTFCCSSASNVQVLCNLFAGWTSSARAESQELLSALRSSVRGLAAATQVRSLILGRNMLGAIAAGSLARRWHAALCRFLSLFVGESLFGCVRHPCDEKAINVCGRTVGRIHSSASAAISTAGLFNALEPGRRQCRVEIRLCSHTHTASGGK